MLIAGMDVRVITRDGELLRHLILNPTKNYQPTGLPHTVGKGDLNASTLAFRYTS